MTNPQAGEFVETIIFQFIPSIGREAFLRKVVEIRDVLFQGESVERVYNHYSFAETVSGDVSGFVSGIFTPLYTVPFGFDVVSGSVSGGVSG